MPENPISATQPDGGTETGEFAFAKPVTETPRIKRRSLKAKSGGAGKPSDNTPQPDREPAPLSTTPAPLSKPTPERIPETKAEPTAKISAPAAVPARATTPTTITSAPSSSSNGPKITSTAMPSPAASAATPTNVAPTATPSQPIPPTTTSAKTASVPAAGPASSPHGTRPATLYYTSKKEKEEPAPMKTIPTTTAPSSSSATLPSSVSRPAASATASRPSPTVDYRANVERQSREQKSVGNILSYVVYALIAFFVISAGLAAYGADIIFAKLHDQSVTVTDLDARYSAANKDLSAKLATAQDALTQNQAQIARQQDLIMKQQEELNRLMSSVTDDAASIKAEKAARAQETANLRGRVRDLENKTSQKY